MIKAQIIATGLFVYIHRDAMPHNSNHGKVVVSKQPNSMAVFSVDFSDLLILG